jgi:hypothetical protein
MKFIGFNVSESKFDFHSYHVNIPGFDNGLNTSLILDLRSIRGNGALVKVVYRNGKVLGSSWRRI